jgi:hypothetical protein
MWLNDFDQANEAALFPRQQSHAYAVKFAVTCLPTSMQQVEQITLVDASVAGGCRCLG